MNKLFFFIIIIALSIQGCKNDDDIIIQAQNQNPNDFSIEVTQITNNSALLKWNSAIDPDGDTITYTVFIEENEIQSQVSTTEFLLDGLTDQTSYSGKVVASDGKTGTSESTFSFTTTNTSNEFTIAWQKSLGGTLNDDGYAIYQTSDQGYIVAGSAESNDGDISDNKGGKDCWIIKLDNEGTLQWETNIGGSNNETVHDIKQTTDGGYIVGAFSTSTDGDVTGNNGMRDFWIIKLNASGAIDWERNFGGSSDDILESIIQVSDGGYVATGFTTSDEIGVSGQSDAWILKIDSLGNLLWETNLGGSQRDIAFSVDQTTDLGYIVAGYTETSENKRDVWIAKLSPEGNLDWEKTYGGSDNEEAVSIEQTNDGGYIIGGYSVSNDGEIGENKGGRDAIIIKTDQAGNIIWKKVIGGSKSEGINEIKQTNDGGYIATGSSSSSDIDVEANNGASDFWILRLGASGDLIWQKNLGDEGDDYAFSIQQTADTGFIVAGTWYTNITGTGEGTTGDFNYWVIKLE
ncbi:fibronectin type III domain-containing protein [Aquimarina sp. 2201CG5-10]|uniref:fibronectin type III domain-containing protein n=1 Tax=Aquimarina callyspongiae TaxID=3098150 RepID=UPI002AB35E19|nr:fibronectin type III domain-containing protein [Aquimarina sp. 2201CG5-10]MDY8135099.1 fibronectin type III domain-containing protein [Aquimarina sp. 2201CG5-10]